MTPLAQAFANEMCKPVAKRKMLDSDGIAGGINDFHFFDCSAASDFIEHLSTKPLAAAQSRYMFLPAEKTWIEFDANCGGRGLPRRAYLLVLDGENLTIRLAWRDAESGLAISGVFLWVPMDGSGSYRTAKILEFEDDIVSHLVIAISALAIINTPRIIGRRQHMPHAGLQRKIAAAHGMVGKFPLRGWTEIMLEVTPPQMADGQIHETRLTGQKCLHFCRRHLRIRNGSLEMVRDHWRGDPALGIKQSRYRLQEPKRRAA